LTIRHEWLARRMTGRRTCRIRGSGHAIVAMLPVPITAALVAIVMARRILEETITATFRLS
jgi:hypothetical protein